MADLIRVDLANNKQFLAALDNLWKHSRKGHEDFLRERAKDLTQDIIGVTPPFGRSKGLSAKQAGEKTTYKEIHKVFTPVDGRRARRMTGIVAYSDMQRLHEKYRSRGKVRRALRKHKKHRVRAGDLKKYSKSRARAVGMLIAGWGSAARSFGIKGRSYPAWVSRHRPASSAKLDFGGNRMTIRLENKVRFAGDVSVMHRRIDWAVNRQAGAMQRKHKHHMARITKRAGF